MKWVCCLQPYGEDSNWQPNTAYLGFFVLILHLFGNNLYSKVDESTSFFEVVEDVCISVSRGSIALSIWMSCYFGMSGLGSWLQLHCCSAILI